MKEKKSEHDIVLFKTDNDKVQLSVFFQDETAWLTQEQMANLFEKGRTTITENIKNIFNEGELDEKVVCRKIRHTTQQDLIERTITKKEINSLEAEKAYDKRPTYH